MQPEEEINYEEIKKLKDALEELDNQEPRPTVAEKEYYASEWAKCFGDAERTDDN